MKTFSMDKFTSNLSYACSGILAAFGALSKDDWTFIVCTTTAILTFVINWIYKHLEHLDKKKKRDEDYAEHKKNSDRRDL